MNESKKKRAKKTDINYTYKSPFPNCLSSLLEENNVTHQTLADIIGVSRQSISQWTIGATKPDIYYLDKMADYFNVSTDYLLGRTEEKTINEDIKKTIKTTGLSEDAINNILMYKAFQEKGKPTFEKNSKPMFDIASIYKSECLSALDELLSHKDFWVVLANAGKYFYTFDELKEIWANLVNPNINKQLEILNSSQPVALFHLQKSIIEVAEKIGNAKKEEIHQDFENAKQALYNETTKAGDK